MFSLKNAQNFGRKKKSLEEPDHVKPDGEDEQCIMTSSWCHKTFFLSWYSWNYYAFVKFGFIGTIIIIIVLYDTIFYLIPIMLS